MLIEARERPRKRRRAIAIGTVAALLVTFGGVPASTAASEYAFADRDPAIKQSIAAFHTLRAAGNKAIDGCAINVTKLKVLKAQQLSAQRSVSTAQALIDVEIASQGSASAALLERQETTKQALRKVETSIQTESKKCTDLLETVAYGTNTSATSESAESAESGTATSTPELDAETIKRLIEQIHLLLQQLSERIQELRASDKTGGMLGGLEAARDSRENDKLDDQVEQGVEESAEVSQDLDEEAKSTPSGKSCPPKSGSDTSDTDSKESGGSSSREDRTSSSNENTNSTNDDETT